MCLYCDLKAGYGVKLQPVADWLLQSLACIGMPNAFQACIGVPIHDVRHAKQQPYVAWIGAAVWLKACVIVVRIFRFENWMYRKEQRFESWIY